MTENEKIEDKKFQIKMLKVQQGTDVIGSIIAIIASLFVAIITTQLTLFVSLSSYISIGILVALISIEIGVALTSIMGSWFIVLFFRDRILREIEDELDKKLTQPKPTETKPK